MKRRDELIDAVVTLVNNGSAESLDGYSAELLYVAQEKPNTFYSVGLIGPDGIMTVGLGFSKAHWPDQWDSDYGHEIALRKAAARIVRQLLSE